jgi:hypothetical protein
MQTHGRRRLSRLPELLVRQPLPLALLLLPVGQLAAGRRICDAGILLFQTLLKEVRLRL